MREIRRIRGHDCAWGASRSPYWSELTKIFLILEMPGRKTKRSICPVRFATVHPQMHVPGRSRLPSNPSVLSSRQSWQLSFVPLTRTKRVSPCTVKSISSPPIRIESERGFRATRVSNLNARLRRSCPATIDSLRRLVPISAVFGLRYRRAASGVDGTGVCDRVVARIGTRPVQ